MSPPMAEFRPKGLLPARTNRRMATGSERLSAVPNRDQSRIGWGQLSEIFLQKVGIDDECRFGAFGRRDNDPLHGARRIPGDKQARQVRRLVLSGLHGAFVVELTPELEEQIRSLRLPGGEEHRASR